MSPADAMRAERDELLAALKEAKAENERLRRSSRDHAPSIGSALEFAGYLADSAEQYLDFMASAESLVDLDVCVDFFRGLRSSVYEFRKRAPSRAKPAEGDSSRDELNNNTAKAETR